MLKSRRGLLAAGLAVVVAGAIGVASTLTAGAEQIPGDGAPSAAAASAGKTPPALLPWGQRPEKISRGAPGASSKTLRAEGLDAAANDTTGSTQPRGRYAPKGLSEKNTVLRSQRTDIKPPEPPPGQPQPGEPGTPESPAPSESDLTPPGGVPAPPTSTGTTDSDPGDPPATTPTSAGTSDPVAPAPTVSTSSSATSTVNYLYNVGTQTATTGGIYTNVAIAKPTLAQADYHTLAELALQSADSKQIVEVGWTVDRVVNGDDDPHLFVYHWVNGTSTCYNGCGFVQYSSTIKPGDTLAYGVTKKFGIQYSDGAWWIAFDTEWVGYFPEKLWLDQGVSAFSTSGLVQVFGEVAASSTTPCTQMGNGLTSDNTSAAAMGSVTLINGPTPSVAVRSTSSLYTVTALSARTFRYGGPGAC